MCIRDRIGDGCTLPTHAIQYTTNDEDLAKTVAELATRVFGDRVAPRIKKERRWLQVYIPPSFHLTHRLQSPVAEWLRGLGVFGLRSHEKFVPLKVFAQPSLHVARFLRHLWATDGCIRYFAGSGHYPAIYYASSSNRLAADIQQLLLRLGINAILTRVSQEGKGRDQYHVTVRGRGDMERFLFHIGGLGDRKEHHQELIEEYFSIGRGNTNRDVVPREVWKRLAVPAMAAAGITTRQLQAGLDTRYCGSTLYKSNLSRERTQKLAAVVHSDALASLADSDIYWDRVATITQDGTEDVYDLTVDACHNFVAGDIVVHNSIEQDSDLVLFIYRERLYNDNLPDEKRNIAEVIISKHRNGPVGKLELLFVDEQTKFVNLDRRR